MTSVALLRGINVGGARQVAMSDVREMLVSLGYTSVQTLLRSGNVVFSAPDTDSGSLAVTIERALEERLGMAIGVVVRTAKELEAVMAANPMREAGSAGSSLHVMFLAGPLTAEARAAIEGGQYPPDEVRCADREIYVWYRKGMSGSKTAEHLGRQLATLAAGTFTDRNWNTLAKLLALARET